MWRYKQTTDIVFGSGESKNLGEYMAQFQLDNALLVAAPSAVRSGLSQQLVQSAKGRILGVFSQIEPDPTVQNVNACAELLKTLGAESVVAVGGGSAMDCAKSAAALVVDECTAEDYLLKTRVPEGMLPMIAIPTTAGSASEVSAGSVISWRERKIKAPVVSPALFPSLAIVDPLLTISCPPSVTAASGLDVLSHALDTLYSTMHQPATDLFALRSCALVFGYLERAYAQGSDVEAREKMSEASVFAGMAFSQARTTASHACSYMLTVNYGLPHGEACAFTLDSFYRINARVYPVLHDYARTLGFRDADDMADGIMKLKKALGMRTTLQEAGIALTDLEGLAQASINVNMSYNIAPISKEDVVELFKRLA